MSNISGTEVYRVRDADGDVIVYDSAEIRILAFDSPVEQSALAKSRPWRLHYAYTQAMMLAPLFTAKATHAVVLGLGGGSLVRALRHGWPTMRITAVERRAAVVQVARDWFLLDDSMPENGRFGVVTADAGDWLLREGPAQDLIFADLYDHAGMDAQQAESGFLTSCAQRLRPGGVLVANLWSTSTEAARHHGQALRAVFGERVLRVSVQGGNSIALAFRDDIPKPRRRDFMEAAQALGLRLDIPLQRHARRLWDENPQRLQQR